MNLPEHPGRAHEKAAPVWETLNPALARRPYRVVLFDFDGTLSLFREGWPSIMIRMMLEGLKEHGLLRSEESAEWAHVEDFVMSLNGKPSILQMQRYAEELRTRGGAPAEPTMYLDEYHRRLLAVVRQRWNQVTSCQASPADWVVPNAHTFLEHLRRRGVTLYLASGTDIMHVRHEADLLGVAEFFGRHLYAPTDNSPDFSKRGVIERLLVDERIEGKDLLSFGDGVTETLEVKRVGGTAIAVASVEAGQHGVHADKRARLAAAGADAVIADYRHESTWLPWLFGESSASPNMDGVHG